MFWLTLALEIAILWLLIAKGSQQFTLIIYVAYQMCWDLASLAYVPFVGPKLNSVIFWTCQDGLYVLQMIVALSLFRPKDLVGHWLRYLSYLSFLLVAIGIGDEWLRLGGHGQYALAAFCGVLVLFSLGCAYLAGEVESWPTWLSLTLWAGGECCFYLHLPAGYTVCGVVALLVLCGGEAFKIGGSVKIGTATTPSTPGYHSLMTQV